MYLVESSKTVVGLQIVHVNFLDDDQRTVVFLAVKHSRTIRSCRDTQPVYRPISLTHYEHLIVVAYYSLPGTSKLRETKCNRLDHDTVRFIALCLESTSQCEPITLSAYRIYESKPNTAVRISEFYYRANEVFDGAENSEVTFVLCV